MGEYVAISIWKFWAIFIGVPLIVIAAVALVAVYWPELITVHFAKLLAGIVG